MAATATPVGATIGDSSRATAVPSDSARSYWSVVAQDSVAVARPPQQVPTQEIPTPMTPAPGGAGVPAAIPAPAAQDPTAPRLNPSGRTITIVAPLKDREIFLGDVELQIGPDDSIQLAVAQVFELLARTLDPAAVESLRPLAEPGVFAPLARFAEAGLPVTFDPRSLELTIAIPPAARGRRSIGLADLDREQYGDFATPEAFTAYLNFNGAANYVHTGSGDTGFGDPLILVDGAARLNGWVLESEATWSGDDGFSRDGTRLVYDDYERLNRWMVGDLLPQGRGFSGVQDIAGVSVARTYALLDPQRNVAPRGGRTFTVDRDSTVEAFVNGRSVRTIRLTPGTYDVSDFPFVQGSNDVELVIVDDTGQREVVSFSLFIDRTQLAPGLSEYAFYGGVRSSRLGDSIEYSDDFAANGFYRYGLNESLTVGANFQYSEDASLVGGEAVWGSVLGTIGGDIAISHLENAGTGWAANVSFERLIQDDDGGTSLLATIEARSRRFGTGGQTAPDNPYVFNTSLGVNRSFGNSSFAGAQVRYAMARDGFEDERSLRLTYGHRLSDRMNVILDADWGEGGFADGTSFRVALVRRIGDTGSARAEYDSGGERARLGYQTSGGRGVGAWSASGNLDLASDTYGLNGSASYAANRADLGLAHSTAFSQSANEISDQRTSFRASTGIAFAGGQFAFGRPVSDGFVIVRPYAGAHDVVIEVEPSPDGFYARSGMLGPALYGQVSAYSPRTVIYDAAEAPPGFDVGQGALRLLPPYRAGYLVTVGSDYGVTAIGRLLNREGEPVTLIAGVAVEQGGEGRRVEIFTNRQGAFGASGLKAGRWRIEMPGQPPLAYDLIVPEAPDGIARAGDLRPVQ
ncbi:MAG: fimbria/pilus outer membrane usher protein [Brevundimonas sp.]